MQLCVPLNNQIWQQEAVIGQTVIKARTDSKKRTNGIHILLTTIRYSTTHCLSGVERCKTKDKTKWLSHLLIHV